MTPVGIESTMMALYASIFKISTNMLAKISGVWVNSTFVHVSKDNMKDYPILLYINLFCGFIKIALIPMIPIKEDIERSMKWLNDSLET